MNLNQQVERNLLHLADKPTEPGDDKIETNWTEAGPFFGTGPHIQSCHCSESMDSSMLPSCHFSPCKRFQKLVLKKINLVNWVTWVLGLHLPVWEDI